MSGNFGPTQMWQPWFLMLICRCVPDYVDMDDLIGGPEIGDMTVYDFLYGGQQNEAVSPAKFTNLNRSTGMEVLVFIPLFVGKFMALLNWLDVIFFYLLYHGNSYILDMRFDGDTIQNLKDNVPALIPISSPIVSKKLSTPPILKRGKRKRRVSLFSI